MNLRIKSCKGVSAIVAAIFMVTMFVLAIFTHLMVQAQQDAYRRAAEERNQLDLERINEKIEITYARIEDAVLNVTVRNNGKETAHLVDLWLRAYNGTPPEDPLWQKLFTISEYVEPDRSLSFTSLDTLDASLNYSLKIVTERGNIASCRIPYPPTEEEEEPATGSGGNIPIILLPSWDNFMYMDKATAASYFKSAYVKKLSKTNDHVLYRVHINNTTTSKIYFYANCTMVQISVDTGNIRIRYIVSNLTTIWDSSPRPFEPNNNLTNQCLNPGQRGYLWFAGNGVSNPQWLDDPSKKYQTVGFILWFRYEGETEARSISLPPLIQLLT